MIAKPASRIILGIDPGIADTGYGLIVQTDSDLALVTCGSIKTAKNLTLPQRLKILAEKLKLIIKQYKPELAAIEELFFCNNAKTALVVGQARGVALLVAAQAELPIVEFTPLQVKQAVTGYGKADKLQVQNMVKIILRLKTIPRPDDAADALAIAICGCQNKLTN